MENLTLEWTNDHANPGKDTFWSYVWYKYGSCLKSTKLNEPLKYFLKGTYYVARGGEKQTDRQTEKWIFPHRYVDTFSKKQVDLPT